MLIDNQCAAQRNHHENPEEPAGNRDKHDACDLEIKAEDHDRRHRHAEAESDRFTGRTRSLHDVVLQDRGVAQTEFGKEPKKGNREHRDWNRRAHG